MPPILYDKERMILDYIMQFIDRYGFAPTLREIGDACGMSSAATVHEHIERLRQKGLIKKLDGASRGLEVVRENYRNDTNASAPQLPIMGFIAAGKPLEPYTDPNEYLAVPPGMIPPNKTGYILKVKGTSMIEDGILDGDYVVIQYQEDAKDGDIVVALLPNGLATLKRIYFEKDRIRLMPSNSEMSPIYVTQVKIQGVCVGLLRRYSH